MRRPRLLLLYIFVGIFCLGCKETPSHQNGPLLKNGDFEFHSLGWPVWEASLHPSAGLEDREGRNGSRCVTLRTQGDAWYLFSHISQEIPGPFVSSTIKVHGHLRTSGNVHGIIRCHAVGEPTADRSDGILKSASCDPVNDPEWRLVEFLCEIPRGTRNLRLEIALEFPRGGLGLTPLEGTQGAAYVDDVEAIYQPCKEKPR